VDNVEVVRSIEDAYNRRDYAALDALIAADLAAHTPGAEQGPPGIEGAKAADMGAWQAFPDKHSEILDIFGEGDHVVAHVSMTGTNRGGLPWLGIPANGRAVDFDWIQISRHGPDGKVVETWAQIDVPKLMAQLGAMPGMGGE
jgi:predicted ester cyclase